MSEPNVQESRQKVLDQICRSNQLLNAKFQNTLCELKWTVEELRRDHHGQPRSISKSVTVSPPPSPPPSPDLRNTADKLRDYESAIRLLGHRTEPETMGSISGEANTMQSSSTASYEEILSQKRDLKRRRMKYRTTKAPPLSYTEEIRQLIGVQGEAWEQFLRAKGTTNKRK